jgi:hypothetical protein
MSRVQVFRLKSAAFDSVAKSFWNLLVKTVSSVY